MRLPLLLTIAVLAGCSNVTPGDPNAFKEREIQAGGRTLTALYGAQRCYYHADDGSVRQVYGWEARSDYWYQSESYRYRGWGTDVWGIDGDTLDAPVHISRFLTNRATLGDTTLYVLRLRTGPADDALRTVVVDGQLREVFSLEDCVALQKNIFNVYADPQKRLDDWNAGQDGIAKNCLLFSARQGFVYDPDSGRIARVPPGGSLIAVRELNNHRTDQINTVLSFAVWRSPQGEGTLSELFLPDLSLLASDLRDLTWDHRGPQFIVPGQLHDDSYRRWRFLCFTHRLEAGWGGFVWTDARNLVLRKVLRDNAIEVGSNRIGLGPNYVPGSLNSRENAWTACDLWVTSIMEQIAEIGRQEAEERRRLAELRRQQEERARAARAATRAPHEQVLAAELDELKQRAWELSLEFRDLEAAQLLEDFLARALKTLAGLAPEESPVVVAAMHARATALAGLAAAWLQGSVTDPPTDVGAALNEAEIVLYHELCPDKDEAEVNVWLLEMVSMVGTANDTDFASFERRFRREAPAGLSSQFEEMQQRRQEHVRRERYANSSYVYSPPEPSWYEQFAGFFTAGAATGTPLPSPSPSGSRSSGSSSSTGSSGPGEFQQWAAQERWKARVQEINDHYSSLQYNYQNQYDY